MTAKNFHERNLIFNISLIAESNVIFMAITCKKCIK